MPISINAQQTGSREEDGYLDPWLEPSALSKKRLVGPCRKLSCSCFGSALGA